MTISPERERQLCAWSTNPADALRAIQFLLTRVRALEECADYCLERDNSARAMALELTAAQSRVRELERREVISITALQEITEADVYARQIADAALEALKGTP